MNTAARDAEIDETGLLLSLKELLDRNAMPVTDREEACLNVLVSSVVSVAGSVRKIEIGLTPFIHFICPVHNEGICIDDRGDIWSDCSLSNKSELTAALSKLNYLGLVGAYSQEGLYVGIAAGIVSRLMGITPVVDYVVHKEIRGDLAQWTSRAITTLIQEDSLDANEPEIYGEDISERLGDLMQCVGRSARFAYPNPFLGHTETKPQPYLLNFSFRRYASLLCGILKFGVRFLSGLYCLERSIHRFPQTESQQRVISYIGHLDRSRIAIYTLLNFQMLLIRSNELQGTYGSFMDWDAVIGSYLFGRIDEEDNS